MRRSPVICVEREMLESKAFLSLNGSAIKVLCVLLGRRQFARIKSRLTRKKEDWVCTNNGQIEFTYKDAERRLGFNISRFKRALDQLVDRGFIDISHHGGGLYGDRSKYAISERWRKYGTSEFKGVPPRRVRKIGFRGRSKKS